MGYPEQFKTFREARGIAREQLAKRARCHRNTVINVESGRPVKFGTIVMLMDTMGYPADSSETKRLALLWLESVTGIRISPTESLSATGPAEPARSLPRTSTQLQAEVTRRRLGLEDIELLTFAARHRKVLLALKAIRDLVDDHSRGGLSSAHG